MPNKKFIYVLNYLKFLMQYPETIHGRTHRDKIKKAVVTIAAYFKASAPVRLQKQ